MFLIDSFLSLPSTLTIVCINLVVISGTTPVVIGAEMLQPDGDYALSVDDAKAWAKERGIPFLHGIDIINALSSGV